MTVGAWGVQGYQIATSENQIHMLSELQLLMPTDWTLELESDLDIT
jgi:hypothetical protein